MMAFWMRLPSTCATRSASQYAVDTLPTIVARMGRSVAVRACSTTSVMSAERSTGARCSESIPTCNRNAARRSSVNRSNRPVLRRPHRIGAEIAYAHAAQFIERVADECGHRRVRVHIAPLLVGDEHCIRRPLEQAPVPALRLAGLAVQPCVIDGDGGPMR